MNKFMIILGALCMLSVGFANDAVKLRPGVLLDATTQSVFVMLPEGGIAAIDVTTGKTRWSTALSDKPLLLVNGRLLSQKQNNESGLLSLVYHSITNGEILNEVELNLPTSVMAAVVDGPGYAFNIEADSNLQNNQLLWSFKGNKVQGMAPELPALSDKNAIRSQSTQPIKFGVIDLDFSNNNAHSSMLTASPSSVKIKTEQKVLAGVEGRQFLSQNGQHVLSTRRTDDNQSISYHWHIFKLNGESLATFQSAHSYAPFLVEDNLLFIIEPETGRLEGGKLVKNPPLLKCINLPDGQSIWQLPIRSIKYFGQLPV